MKIPFLTILFAAVGLSGCEGPPGTVTVSEPWILQAPAGASSMAGYGVIHNGTQRPVIITGAGSPAFDRVHLHETRLENGQARMSPVDVLTLPPGGRAVMHPGGLHLMLMAPGAALQAGDSAEIRLHFADGDTLTAVFPVRDQPPAEK